MDSIKIYALESDSGFYITDNLSQNTNIYTTIKIFSLFFDGQNPEKTFHSNWAFIPKKPSKIEKIVPVKRVNHRFVLADIKLISENIPLEISKSEAGDNSECGEFIWKDKYQMYRSLYIPIYDELPEEREEIIFEFTVIGKVSNVKPPPEFRYPCSSEYESYSRKMEKVFIDRNQIIHQEIDKIIFPSLILHEQPVKLSSEDTYKIIREHIKRNINPKVAKITSDYDFCFTVEKIISLAKPYQTKYEYTPMGKRKIEVRTEYRSDRLAPCFEMTHDRANYQKYTSIKGVEGNSELELKEQLDAYLSELMAKINEPLAECPNCNGCGVINIVY